jgi:hypothetical protein
MKSILKFLFSALFLTALISSCKKEENKVYFEGGTNPVLSASVSSNLILLKPNEKNQLMTLSWTNPDYKFTTGVSSQNVSYTLQFDTTGSNFTSKTIGEKVISNDLSVKLTVGDVNAILLAMGLAENMPHNIEIRLKSNLINSSATLYSNVFKYVITPYLDVVFPVPANLYITGSASPLSWQCACANDGTGVTQKFTKVNSSKFELTINLSANNSYLLLPVWSSWNAKYGGTGANNTNVVTGDTFKPDGGDLKSPATSGLYKIVVDFKTGRFTVTPQ